MKWTTRLRWMGMGRALLVLALLGVMGSCANPGAGAGNPGTGKVVGGPYVLHATRRSATVAWIVEEGQVSARATGPAAATMPAVVEPVLRVRKTTLTNLRPNTRYEYDTAPGAEAAAEAGKGSFKTPPMRPGPYWFMVYGDNRTRDDVHAQVVAQMLKKGTPDFLIQTGDMVANGADDAQWPVFFGIEKDLLRHTAFFPSPGNHERGAPEYFEFFDQSGPHYSFDWGNSHFSVIDSDVGSAGSDPAARDAFWAEQVRFLEADLQAHQAADFRFVVAHHPPFTAVSDRQNDNPHMKALVPLLEKYHVSAGLFGHDHTYQHYLKNGVHYVTSGGGGAPLYDVNSPPEGITLKAVSIENFVVVKVEGTVAHVQAIDITGQTIEEFDIRGNAQRPAGASATQRRGR